MLLLVDLHSSGLSPVPFHSLTRPMALQIMQLKPILIIAKPTQQMVQNHTLLTKLDDMKL